MGVAVVEQRRLRAAEVGHEDRDWVSRERPRREQSCWLWRREGMQPWLGLWGNMAALSEKAVETPKGYHYAEGRRRLEGW